MANEIFAAIDVGSYELSMKIFELSPKKGVHELNHVRHRIDLGTETYATGKVGSEHVHELVRVLQNYSEIMKEYGVSRYQAYGTSALRETDNIRVLLEQLRQRTGLSVEVLSNSEQRLLDCKAIALKHEEFNRLIEKPTAIVDIGGGSIQISLFDEDMLVTTQNLRLGVLRLRQSVNLLGCGTRKYKEVISALVESQLSVFESLYLKNQKYENLIIIDDYISPVMQKLHLGILQEGYAEAGAFTQFVQNMSSQSRLAIAKQLGIPEENIPMMYISGILIHHISQVLGSKTLWAPGMTLCDGIAYEFAEKKKYIKTTHDFERDIIACAENISKRYKGSKKRAQSMMAIALPIFDKMKKIHGLGKRERLLLQISVILHDCGKYISMVNLGECSYQIIMATEIIGLSHMEREIVANVVMFNHAEFIYYGNEQARYVNLSLDAYRTIAKLSAILRIANGIDRTHQEKFKDIKITLKDNELIIGAPSTADVTIEQGLLGWRAEFFEEVFGIRPVIRAGRMD